MRCSESVKNIPASDKTTGGVALDNPDESSHEGGTAMSSPTGSRIALVAGDASLTYLIERYTERSGLGIEVVADPPPANVLIGPAPVLVWFPSLESLARWRAASDQTTGNEHAVVVCTSVPDERRARDLGADYCVLLPLTYDDFRVAVSAVGITVRRDA